MKQIFKKISSTLALLVKVFNLIYNFNIKIWSEKDKTFWDALIKKPSEFSYFSRPSLLFISFSLFICIVDYSILRRSLNNSRLLEKLLGHSLKEIYFDWIYGHLQLIVNFKFVLISISLGILVINFLYYNLRFYFVLRDTIVLVQNSKDEAEVFYLILVIFVRLYILFLGFIVFYLVFKAGFGVLYRLV